MLTRAVSHKKLVHLVLGGLVLLSLVFCMGRAHYFLSSLPRFYLFCSDARWWWIYQSQLDNEDVFAGNVYFEAKKKTRFITDSILQKAIVQLSHTLSLPRIILNRYMSTAVYLTTFILLYILGLSVMHEPKWALFFCLVLAQSTYARWLRYDVFVPKMLGFMMYPILLFAVVKITEGRKGPLLFALLSIGAFWLYPGSIVYCAPVLVPVGLLGLIMRRGEEDDYWRPIGEYVVGIGVLASMMVLMKYLRGEQNPPPLYITEYYYKNHLFVFPKRFLLYARTYGDYFLLSSVSLGCLLRWGSEQIRRRALVLYAIFLGCLLGGIITHMLGVQVPEIRMLWVWRLAYYTYVPALLLIVMAVQQTASRLSAQTKLSKVMIWLLIVILPGWIIYRSPELNNNIRGAIKIYGDIVNGVIVDRYEQRVSGLARFARVTDENSLFLLPHRRFQDRYTDMFESECCRGCLLSRNERYLMVVEDELSEPYFRLLKAYDAIDDLKEEEEFGTQLIQFAEEVGASYVILSKEHRFRLALPCAYEDAFWLVYPVGKVAEIGRAIALYSPKSHQPRFLVKS